ncbi:tyrosine-type recombinase/integrase, partial [Frankia casuarinae]|uniref:tyrosine-type recombinase/integrase n=2 Tax=Frankia TaxID=1854 RepID=UPI001F3EFC06
AALTDAERMDLVSRNVAKSVQAPKLGDAEPRELMVEQARRFLDVAAGDRLEALFVVALTMGLRRGELLGLRWDDVDLDAGTLRVVRSAQRVSGTLRLVETKTRGSRRPVPIPATTVEALRRHQKYQEQERADAGTAWKENGLVFASTVGTLMEPRNVTRRVQQLRGRASLPTLRLHDFRHACASFLLAAGVEPRTVMEILGHATMRMTMERYGHALPERLRAASDAMDKLMTASDDDADGQGGEPDDRPDSGDSDERS